HVNDAGYDLVNDASGVFTEFDKGKAEVLGKSENGRIETYNVAADTSDGRTVYAQFSVKGGKLILFNAFKDCKKEVYGEKECKRTAEEFLVKAGFDNMEAVWEYSAGNTMHYNFVYKEDGVLVYPDMVKVNVCMETCRVTAIDADGYFMNHGKRSFSKPLHTLEEAAAKVNPKLEIVWAKEAVVPVGNGKEKAAYEFRATADGETYYLYLDAETLKQADLFKVVETSEGRLLV
ncbi:MAG: germination protein YpeB, partial [Clostridia bacterium]|nr:germination protein YpeB [Clostridia bacterium]